MDVIQLLSFYEVVRTGSFSKASEKVFRTQSAISYQMKNLEQELKVKLFDRSEKAVVLTWEGKMLFEFISKFLDNFDRLKSMFEEARCGKRGTLTVATTSSTMTHFFPNVVGRLAKDSANIKFKIITCISPEIQAKVAEGIADLGVGVKLDLIPKKLNFLPWKTFDKVLIAVKEHPLPKRELVTLEDIVRYPLILHREGTVIRKEVEEVFIRKNLAYEIIVELDVTETIKKYVEMGVGISIISSHTLTSEDKERFFLSNVSHLFKDVRYGIYYKKGKYVTSAMKQFIRFFAPELLAQLRDEEC